MVFRFLLFLFFVVVFCDCLLCSTFYSVFTVCSFFFFFLCVCVLLFFVFCFNFICVVNVWTFISIKYSGFLVPCVSV